MCSSDLVKSMAEKGSFTNFNLDINLRDEGLLDSLGFVEMLVRMEEVFGFATAPTEVTYEEIDTPRRVIAYVKKRVAAL